MAPVIWLGVACVCWSGVAVGCVWLAPPAAACSLFGALDLWAAFAGADEEEE